MRFSLILATVNRDKELENFIIHLQQGTYQNYELIIVDQSDNDCIKNVYYRHRNNMDIVYVHLTKKGLSHARNVGLSYAKGDIIAFPDDDCWYGAGVLELVKNLFSTYSVGGICGCPVDKYCQPLIHNFLGEKSFLDKKNVWHGSVSITIFLKQEVIKCIGNFDETLGVGANSPYGSGEETDYLLRALENGFNIMYMPVLKIFHPRKDSICTVHECIRARSYGRGMGAVLRKHHYDYFYLLKTLIRPAGGALLALLSFNMLLALYRTNTFIGRIEGWVFKGKERARGDN